jgi:hypothetical protein
MHLEVARLDRRELDAAPVNGSRSRWTIELNCLPRRVETKNRPPCRRREGSRTTAKCAFPSGVANRPSAKRVSPPHWIESPCFSSFSMPA